MKKATIQIRNDTASILKDAADGFLHAWNNDKAEPAATFTFSSPAQLFSVITPKRWDLIEHLQKIGPTSIRGLARSLQRDVKRVHDDVTALIEWGLVARTDDAKICVPFDVIHADFDLRAVA
ncbi:HVO_A0114 family putative DNA-binding protein [Phyllobacterium meliloti]|uniref:HVO_A0114 family putative DNA-binding protein n=1 Tax=Phyllobacterium meliloti TaxID=555317 RepID=UPI001D1347B2|nr:transcriptional regulator [Phyllobacterium sp. T1293]UGX85417.1 transcriptional regulator [Phyllobacterium sp. T1293]